MMHSNHDLKTKIVLSVIAFFTLLLLAISCRERPSEPEPEPEYNIYLSVEDVLCTWVTLKVTLPDSGKINSFALDRNDSTVATYTCYDNDTLITNEGLTPDTDYSYTVRFLKGGKIKAESELIAVHTMPTTSHDFVWEVDTLGGNFSTFYDVAAINENDVWAVGEIKINDKLYGAGHWDGEKWNLVELIAGSTIVIPRGILILSSNDIWFACGSIFHWDGTKTTLEWLRDIDTPEAVEKIWGTSSSNLYFVGNAGTIVHYNGSTFTRMTSGTDADLLNIDGIYDPDRDKSRIWVTGVGILLYYDGSVWQEVFGMDKPIFKDNFNNPNAVYVPDDRHYVVSVWGGDNSGLYAFDQRNLLYYVLMSKHDLFVKGIHGNSINDLFLVGEFNRIYHFNGSTIQKFPQLEGSGTSLSVSCVNNHVFVVGDDGSFYYRAVVYRGVR